MNLLFDGFLRKSNRHSLWWHWRWCRTAGLYIHSIFQFDYVDELLLIIKLPFLLLPWNSYFSLGFTLFSCWLDYVFLIGSRINYVLMYFLRRANDLIILGHFGNLPHDDLKLRNACIVNFTKIVNKFDDVTFAVCGKSAGVLGLNDCMVAYSIATEESTIYEMSSV